MQDYSISIANTLLILQYCTEPSIWYFIKRGIKITETDSGPALYLMLRIMKKVLTNGRKRYICNVFFIGFDLDH